MSRIQKRSYSPTIDDLRQYNIKRQRLLDDLEALNLSASASPKPYEAVQPKSTPTIEYIPDIDEFLLMNQDDRDVLESSKHITDIQSTDPGLIVIPEGITRIKGLSQHDANVSVERILAKRGMNGAPLHSGTVTSEEILLDYEIRMNWSLVKYVPPSQVVYQHWERWWMNVHKLDEFMRQMNEEDDDLMTDDNDYYYDNSTQQQAYNTDQQSPDMDMDELQSDIDMMEID